MKIVTCILLALCLFTLNAQTQKNCGFTEAYESLFNQDPHAKSRFEKITEETSQSNKNSNKISSANSFTIPVVFHVLHLGGSENISDAQIKDEIAVLNNDYRKLNADITNVVTEFTGITADCNIQFTLATIDENGKCTTGITRHYDVRTDWTAKLSDYIYTWNPSKYLNIYVVRSINNGAAGYTFLPGTVPAAVDAIVVLSNYVGSIETSNPYNSRVLTHETGHWFNLSHTWGNSNNPQVACGDDGVGDTPVTKGHYACNLANSIDCNPGIVENIQNYMEYSYCCNMFTQGQRTRMHNCLNSSIAGRNTLSTNANLLATGVINQMLNCAPKAEYVTNTNMSCVGNSVVFLDQSYNAPVNNWLWTCALAVGNSTVQNGILNFATSGLAAVKLKVGNNFGNDSVVKQQIITVLSSATNSGNIALNQGFETGIFPDNNWIASIPKYGSPFQQISTVGATGSNCIWVNNYYDNPNSSVSFYSPALNLYSTISAQLSFKFAYAQQNNANNDKLKIYISANCGSSWVEVYSVAGVSLSTTGSISSTPFLNPLTNQWKTENVNLLSFSGNSKVYLKFEFTPDPNGPGNNLFIDDININSVVGLKENTNNLSYLNVFPNPFTSEVIIENTSINPINSVNIYDVSLRKLKDFSFNNEYAQKIILNDLKELKEGIYFIEIKAEAGTKVVKLIKE